MRLFPAVVVILTLVLLTGGEAESHDFSDVDFSKADSVALLYPDYSLYDLPGLSRKLTDPFQSDAEKFRAIFKWVCSNVRNDYDLYAENEKKRETLSGDELKVWNKYFSTVAFKQLLKTHATVCTGYAYLIRELSLHAGMSCEVVDGYGRNVVSNIGGQGIVNHSWNAVKLDGKWYLCDATWASGGIDPQQKLSVQKYNNTYFLSDPALFVHNHYPLEAKWTLLNGNHSLQEFLNDPLIYYAAIRERVQFIEPSTFELTVSKGGELGFAFRGRAGLGNGLKLRIGNTSTSDELAVQTISDTECLYQISHVFRFKGTYAVHVLLNDEYLYSYHLTVK
jgi:hypothetical protein